MLRRIYAPLTEGAYYAQPDALPGACSASRPAPLLVTSAQSAEIIKHASNAFLALKISFINAVANLAEAVDADIEDIAAGMGLDSRIGPRFLRAGLGYGGSCFPKDVAAFHWVAQQRGVDFQLLDEVRKINDDAEGNLLQQSALRAVDAARQAAGGAGPGLQRRNRRHPRIAGHRCDRRSCSRAARSLPPTIRRPWSAAQEVLPPSDKMRYAASAYEAASNADAVLILTDWKEFADLDLVRLNQEVRFPIVIDGRNLFKPADHA